MKKRKVMKWVNNIVTTVLFVLLISVATMVMVTKISGGEPEMFGYQLKTVLSGSMEPGIQTGSIIAVKPGGDMTRFKANDVITFQEEDGKLITHRITEVQNSGDHVMYRTKGDNNNAEDSSPVLSGNVVAEYTGFTVPYVGYLVNAIQTKNGAFFMLIPGILMLIYSGFVIWKALSELELKQKRNQESS
ncbi:Signal peptidase I [Lentibacillus sp. JNUCC-1]|uniref:signal peptidase I SipW n=1 Tax=Lentibacillus sp. JNUCC-1 TaxID=2654513 RepID=UPI0012E865F1|nr:signal peptidase I [Lentibacillus sp. JNUCC-1]MUV38595.1 Signal peptidase I [Lentibacillus sp. JNUCC-1]